LAKTLTIDYQRPLKPVMLPSRPWLNMLQQVYFASKIKDISLGRLLLSDFKCHQCSCGRR